VRISSAAVDNNGGVAKIVSKIWSWYEHSNKRGALQISLRSSQTVCTMERWVE